MKSSASLIIYLPSTKERADSYNVDFEEGGEIEVDVRVSGNVLIDRGTPQTLDDPGSPSYAEVEDVEVFEILPSGKEVELNFLDLPSKAQEEIEERLINKA